MKIHLDRRRCMGTGNCVLAAPQYFAHDEEGLVLLREDAPSNPDSAVVEAAISACPTAVISIAEDDVPGMPD